MISVSIFLLYFCLLLLTSSGEEISMAKIRFLLFQLNVRCYYSKIVCQHKMFGTILLCSDLQNKKNKSIQSLLFGKHFVICLFPKGGKKSNSTSIFFNRKVDVDKRKDCYRTDILFFKYCFDLYACAVWNLISGNNWLSD